MPTGTLTRKIHRQPPLLISRPPRVGPSAGARNSTSAAEIGTLPLPSPPRPSRMLSARGTSGAPAKPCTARAATSTSIPGARAHAAEAPTNATMLQVSTRMVPKRLARYDVAASETPSASR